MIGLDSNVLIRYIIQDDPVQSKIVNQLLDEAVKLENFSLLSHSS